MGPNSDLDLLFICEDDIFENNLEIKSRAPVIVYDDDHFYMASVIAEKLALDGYKVTYVTPLASVATWTDLTLEQDKIINKFNSLNIQFKVNYKVNTNGKFINTLSGDIEDFNTENIIFVGARLQNDELCSQAKEKMNNKIRLRKRLLAFIYKSLNLNNICFCFDQLPGYQ